jgi:hypothetical protein
MSLPDINTIYDALASNPISVSAPKLANMVKAQNEIFGTLKPILQVTVSYPRGFGKIK